MNNTRNIPPPLGLMPRYIWEERRIEEIKSAIKRCLEQNYPISEEWIQEYNELVKGNEE